MNKKILIGLFVMILVVCSVQVYSDLSPVRVIGSDGPNIYLRYNTQSKLHGGKPGWEASSSWRGADDWHKPSTLANWNSREMYSGAQDTFMRGMDDLDYEKGNQRTQNFVTDNNNRITKQVWIYTNAEDAHKDANLIKSYLRSMLRRQVNEPTLLTTDLRDGETTEFKEQVTMSEATRKYGETMKDAEETLRETQVAEVRKKLDVEMKAMTEALEVYKESKLEADRIKFVEQQAAVQKILKEELPAAAKGIRRDVTARTEPTIWTVTLSNGRTMKLKAAKEDIAINYANKILKDKGLININAVSATTTPTKIDEEKYRVEQLDDNTWVVMKGTEPAKGGWFTDKDPNKAKIAAESMSSGLQGIADRADAAKVAAEKMTGLEPSEFVDAKENEYPVYQDAVGNFYILNVKNKQYIKTDKATVYMTETTEGGVAIVVEKTIDGKETKFSTATIAGITVADERILDQLKQDLGDNKGDRLIGTDKIIIKDPTTNKKIAEVSIEENGAKSTTSSHYDEQGKAHLIRTTTKTTDRTEEFERVYTVDGKKVNKAAYDKAKKEGKTTDTFVKHARDVEINIEQGTKITRTYEIDDKGKETKKYEELTVNVVTGEPTKYKGLDGKEDEEKLKELQGQYTWRTRLATVEFVTREFQGLGYLSTLFMSDDDLAAWRETVDNFFCSTIILGDVDCWVSKVCAHQYDKTRGNVAYVLTPSDTIRVAAHVEGERSSAIEVEGQPTQYLYKLTFWVRATDNDVYFNVQLIGDETIFLYPAPIMLRGDEDFEGEQYSGKGDLAIVQYSTNRYDSICLRFSKGNIDDICNRIVQSDYSKYNIIKSQELGLPTGMQHTGAPDADQYKQSQNQIPTQI